MPKEVWHREITDFFPPFRRREKQIQPWRFLSVAKVASSQETLEARLMLSPIKFQLYFGYCTSWGGLIHEKKLRMLSSFPVAVEWTTTTPWRLRSMSQRNPVRQVSRILKEVSEKTWATRYRWKLFGRPSMSSARHESRTAAAGKTTWLSPAKLTAPSLSLSILLRDCWIKLADFKKMETTRNDCEKVRYCFYIET